MDSDDDLILEKTLNMLNVGILIKSFLNENLDHYYSQVFLEKCLSYYERIDVSDLLRQFSKAIVYKEGIICHYWYFLDKEFKFQASACYG